MLLHAEVAFKLESRIGSLYPGGGGDTLFLRWLDFLGIGSAVFKRLLELEKPFSFLIEVSAAG